MRWFRRGLSRLGFGGSGFPCPDLRVFRLCFFCSGFRDVGPRSPRVD